jgi:hypothetical protein
MYSNNASYSESMMPSANYPNDSKSDLISLPPDYAKLPPVSQPLCLFPPYFSKGGIEITMQKKASVTAVSTINASEVRMADIE